MSWLEGGADRWALLGSVGWRQWSKFGKVDIGVDSNDPKSLTANADDKDKWHGAIPGRQSQVEALAVPMRQTLAISRGIP